MRSSIRFYIVELFLLKPWETAIDFLTVYKVGFTIKFGEPFFFCTFHKDSKREPEDKKKREGEVWVSVEKKSASADKKPGGIDWIANNGVDAMGNKSVFFNRASDFGFDSKKVNEESR